MAMKRAKERISVKGGGDKTATVAEVEVEKRLGGLALHRERFRGRGWTITHVPTGLRAAAVKDRAQAETILQKLARLDWNFRSPKSRKITAMYPKVKRIMERVTGNWRTTQF